MKGREVVHATRTGRREPRRWKGSPPSKAEPPESGLQKQRGWTLWVLTASGTYIWNVKRQQLCSPRVGRARGHWEGELLSPRRQSSARHGNKGAGHHPFSLPFPSWNSKGNQFPSLDLLAPCRKPNAVLLWIHPSNRPASFPVLQGPSNRAPPMAKRSKPTPPAPVHLVDPPLLIHPWPDPMEPAPQAWQSASRPYRGHTTAQ